MPEESGPASLGTGPCGQGPGDGWRAALLTFDPHIGSCGNGKNQEEEDEDEGLQVVCGHSLDPKENGAQQLALWGGRDRGFPGGRRCLLQLKASGQKLSADGEYLPQAHPVQQPTAQLFKEPLRNAGGHSSAKT